MSESSVCFDVHGVQVEISANVDGRRYLEWVAEDFSYFRVSSCLAPEIRIVLGQSSETLQKKLEALSPAFKTRMCRAHGWGRTRVCDYGQGVLVSVHRSGRETSIEISLGNGTDLGYEATYSVLLSALGECLDRRGFHRVHALGLARARGERKNVLVLLPTGGGKSAIAALLVGKHEVRIFSDESPLLRGGKIYPFPVRGALRPEVAHALGISTQNARRFKRKLFPEKLLFPFDPTEVAEAAPLNWVLIGRQSGQANGLTVDRSPRLVAYAKLADSAVVGRGLAQMSEYLIRGDSIWNLPKIAWKRLQCAREVLKNAKVGWFDVGNDARQNAESLALFLK